MAWSTIILFCIFVGLSVHNSVKVSIYYEALCSDSTWFIKNQLFPNYHRLRDYIQVDFVPFGKATHNKINGTWIFDCQHGENECYGNLMQACALAQTHNQTAAVNFVNCVMTARNPAANTTVLECAKVNNFSRKELTKCSTNGTGSEILASYGDRTYKVEPNIGFVPTIIFNDVYDSALQETSLADFYGTVIKVIGHNRTSRAYHPNL